jgi:CheY-like chemotaxis protein
MMHGKDSREATRVLVVEDEPSARDAMQRFLQFCGYSVSVAASANEAIKLAMRCPPDVLVCDWKLDGEGDNKDKSQRDNRGVDGADGVDTAVDLQRRFRLAVILVTAHQLEDLKSKARRTGLDVSIFRRKPLSLSRLANDIASLQANAES